MDIVALGTPFGLAFASGLNAYLPMLAYTLSVRWLNLYRVNPQFGFITQTWFIAILVVLALLDFIANKIPLIDLQWNAIHSFIRPIAGAVVALIASSHALQATPGAAVAGHAAPGAIVVALSALTITGIGLLLVFIVGGVLAAFSHRAKSTTRLVSTLTSGGLLNGVLSLLEDVLVVVIILVSLFASALMFILLVLLVLILTPRILRPRRSWIGRRWRE